MLISFYTHPVVYPSYRQIIIYCQAAFLPFAAQIAIIAAFIIGKSIAKEFRHLRGKEYPDICPANIIFNRRKPAYQRRYFAILQMPRITLYQFVLLPSGVCSCISAFLTAANSLNVSCAFCDRILSKAENNSICFLR